jgi:hypothetical protein
MSKIKRHLEDQVVIEGCYHEETAWKRYIYFDYEGKRYEITLFWDEFNGYESYWRVPDKVPNWVLEWDEEAHQGMSFEHYLDDLTFERKN